MTDTNTDSCYSHRRRHRGRHARKERVLHTRVSEQLSQDIRNFAEDLRVPASNLVRNVLEEVFTMVDGVSDDMGGLFDDLIEEAEGVRERVRKQAKSRSRTGSPRRRRTGLGRRRRRSHADDGLDDSEVESELEHDEASEEAEATSAGESASSEEERPRAAELFPEILGWQPLVLNRDFTCGRCARDLAAGESAFLGLGETGLTQTALCGRCAGHR